MTFEQEYKKLQKRFLIPTELKFDKNRLDEKNVEALFLPAMNEIVLKDRRRCRRRFFSVLHEICHAVQLREGRFLIKGCLRKRYEQEVEAEMFAIEWYERLYAKKYGSCLKEKWSLAPYNEYIKYFKHQSK